MSSSSFDPLRQDPIKKPWQDHRRPIAAVDVNHFRHPTATASSSYRLANPNITRAPFTNPKALQHHHPPPSFSSAFHDDDLVAAVVPPVTVVLDGRCICQRISLHKHGSYQSLAAALHRMFADVVDGLDHGGGGGGASVDLSNAVPGYLIAYEDMDNDLLLAGDLNWKDFVRVAKRIRIVPAKGKSRKLMQKED